jgi:NitT/TauT family transport system substrate-binding protein
VRSRRFGGSRAGAVLGLFAVAATALSAGCTSSSGSGSPEQSKITVGVLAGSIGCAPYLLAQQKGYFASQGLNVTTRVETTDSSAIADLASGAVNLTCGGYASYFAGQAGGKVRLHIAAAGYVSAPNSLALVVQSNNVGLYGDPSVLAGKRVAVDDSDASGEITLGSRLAEVNLSLNNVVTVPMSESEMQTALQTGNVAAAVMMQPYAAVAAEQGLGTAESLASGRNQSMALDGYFTTQSFQLSDPNTVAAFTRAIEQAQLLAKNTYAVRAAMLAENVGFNASVTSVMAVGTFPTTLDTNQLQLLANEMLDDGLLPVQITVSDLTAGSGNLVS